MTGGNIRTIYHQDGKTFGPEGNAEQIVHEFDFLVTDQSEWFFVLAIFGVEFAINLGGPEISAIGIGLSRPAALVHCTPTGMAALPRCPISHLRWWTELPIEKHCDIQMVVQRDYEQRDTEGERRTIGRKYGPLLMFSELFLRSDRPRSPCIR